MTADFDRECPGGGPGEGVPLLLPNGLLRHLGPFGACDAILSGSKVASDPVLLLRQISIQAPYRAQ